MSARKSIYAIADQGCDGGVSPNAFVPKITAEVRLHFPPNTVAYDEALGVLLDVYEDARRQLINYFEERRTVERR